PRTGRRCCRSRCSLCTSLPASSPASWRSPSASSPTSCSPTVSRSPGRTWSRPPSTSCPPDPPPPVREWSAGLGGGCPPAAGRGCPLQRQLQALHRLGGHLGDDAVRTGALVRGLLQPQPDLRRLRRGVKHLQVHHAGGIAVQLDAGAGQLGE